MRFFYTNEVTFGKFLDHLRMGIGHQKNQPNDQKVRTFSPTPLTSRWEEELEVELVTNANDLINRTYIIEPP